MRIHLAIAGGMTCATIERIVSVDVVGKCEVIDNHVVCFVNFKKKCGLHIVIWAGNRAHSDVHSVGEVKYMRTMSHWENECRYHHPKSKRTVWLRECE